MTKTLAQIHETLCTECGGVCCKQAAGIYWPDQIELTVEAITARVKVGAWAIDWWEGDPRPEGGLDRVYYVRPAHKNAQGAWLDASLGGECFFLDDRGCRLPLEERPIQCRMLIPLPLKAREENGGCQYTDGYNGKEAAARAWLPHQALMDDVVWVLQG